MTRLIRQTARALGAAIIVGAATVHAQIDPDARRLLHLGVTTPLNGNDPMGAYAFCYWNMPNVPTTNQSLRLAIAPTYVDSELGFKSLLGPNTDFAGGGAGGTYCKLDEKPCLNRPGTALRFDRN